MRSAILPLVIHRESQSVSAGYNVLNLGRSGLSRILRVRPLTLARVASPSFFLAFVFIDLL
jgi:hypothetical protein